MTIQRTLGELSSTVKAMDQRVAELRMATDDGIVQIGIKIDNHCKEDNDRFHEHSKRIGALERWRAWIAGGLTMLAFLVSMTYLLKQFI